MTERETVHRASWLKRAWRLYADGFRSQSRTSRTLWVIVIVKLIVMFAILRPFFFPNHTKRQAAEHNISGSEWVQQDLINRAIKDSTSGH